MSDTNDPVLIGLRADFGGKRAELDRIIADPNATGAAVARGKTLADELGELKGKIDRRHDEVRVLAEVKGQSEELKTWEAAPRRTLPFSGAGGRKAEGRIELVSSEVDRKVATGGFKSLGHFIWASIKRGRHNDGDPTSVREMKSWGELQRKGWQSELESKSPSGLFEDSDPDGGDLIPMQFSNSIYERMVAQNQILSRLSPITLVGNSIEVPALKEDSRADGSRGGGVLGYWAGEADQYTKTKPQFRKISGKLHKLTVLTYMTEELLNDSPTAIDTYSSNLAAKEINFKLNDAIINGTGAGMPLGIMTSGAKVTASAVTGQGNTTFTYNNVTAMFSRIIAGQRSSLVWLYNQDVEPQMFLMYQATGTTGVPIFTPNSDGGFNLLGRPTLVMEQCQTLGTEGDVIAFATDGYFCVQKGGVYSSMNMWLRWDYDEFAMKWRFRFDGQPYDLKPLTPFKGSNTVSSIVTLNSSRT